MEYIYITATITSIVGAEVSLNTILYVGNDFKNASTAAQNAKKGNHSELISLILVYKLEKEKIYSLIERIQVAR